MPKPKYIWDKPCENCPSVHREPDPEAKDFEHWYKTGQIGIESAIFPCAWRPKKYCKGVCDKLGVTENQIAERQDLIDRLNPKYLARKIWICDYSLKGIGGLGERKRNKQRINKSKV